MKTTVRSAMVVFARQEAQDDANSGNRGVGRKRAGYLKGIEWAANVVTTRMEWPYQGFLDAKKQVAMTDTRYRAHIIENYVHVPPEGVAARYLDRIVKVKRLQPGEYFWDGVELFSNKLAYEAATNDTYTSEARAELRAIR
jgi:hypothetical protein